MLYILLLFLIGIIFHTWFTFLPISAGDLSFFFKEHMVEYLNPPFMWETFRYLGFGGDSFISQGVYLYNIPLGILGNFLDYGFVERIIWFYPILLVGSIAPLILGRTLNIFPSKFYPLISFIYFLNTYFFMIMGGGQLTVVFGYITIPVALILFLRVLAKVTLLNILCFSFIFSLLIAFDYRYTYIFLVLLFIYTIFSFFHFNSVSEVIILGKKYIMLFFASIFITLGIHAFWLLPYSFYFQNPSTGLTAVYTSDDAVQYFSFATFENSFSLFHPYWPENVFGKVGFMKAEFLFLPILAYTSLLFLQRKKEYLHILFFAFLGLVGAFLAKGANEPFGEVYLWLFTNIPGFVMFRDPTKWYTLVALSYSILIPFSVWKMYEWLQSQPKFQISNFKFQIKSKNQIFNFQNLFLILTVLYLIFLIRPAIMGEVGGTLKTVIVPQEYIDFKNFILRENDFFRVLWVPTTQRFTFYSNINPAISGKDFFNTFEQDGVIKALQGNEIEEFLKKSAVKYIVVPSDTQKEIFLKDRKYDLAQYTVTAETLRKISWLREVKNFGKIIVFEINNPKDHFYSNSSIIQIHAKFINPTEYKLDIRNGQKGDIIIFVESYNRNWYMNDSKNIFTSDIYDNRFNSFVLKRPGDYTASVYYKPQVLVKTGLTITVMTLATVIVIISVLSLRKKKYD